MKAVRFLSVSQKKPCLCNYFVAKFLNQLNEYIIPYLNARII